MKNGPYILVVAPKSYPGKKYRGRYSYQHHVNYWKVYGLVVQKGQNIHHLNGIKTDNRISNLELVSIKEHSQKHAKGKSTSKLVCANCRAEFKRETRKINKKYLNHYCNRKCMGSSQGKANWRRRSREFREHC